MIHLNRGLGVPPERSTAASRSAVALGRDAQATVAYDVPTAMEPTAPAKPPATADPRVAIDPDSPRPPAGLLRAFRHRNYRIFFAGNLVSMTGTWLTQVATAWLVYRLASEANLKAAALLGYVGFVSQLPMFGLVAFTGVLVDRWDRRRVLVCTQTAAMLTSFVLAGLAMSGVIRIWHVLLVAAARGLVNAFDIPARQAFVVEMVDDRADLANAIALNSTTFNLSRLVGPAVAGWLIATVGEGPCFLIDGLSYLAVIAGLLVMRLPPAEINRERKHILRELRDGVVYAFGFRPTRAIIGYVAVMSLMGFAMPTLMPIFADAFTAPGGNGAKTLGLLSAAVGVGALGGGIVLASRASVVGLGRLIAAAGAGYGLCLLAFSFVASLWFALPALAASGFCFMVMMAGSNTVLQTIADDDKRGRLMSFFSMGVMGMAPFGALLAGTLAARTSPATAIEIAGITVALAAGAFALVLPTLRPLVRPIYVRKGILPDPLTAVPEPSVVLVRDPDRPRE